MSETDKAKAPTENTKEPLKKGDDPVKAENKQDDNNNKPLDFKSFGNDVAYGTIKFIVFIFVGSSFAYLTKIINERGGLGGTDITKPPFMSKFGLLGCDVSKASSMLKSGLKKATEFGKKMVDNAPISNETKNKVSSKLDNVDATMNKKKGKVPFSVYAKHSLEEWNFPYKNSVLCNKENVYYEPLNYRLTRWFVSTIALSYAYGRLALSSIFEMMENDSVSFWLGPIVVYLMLFISPIYGVMSHGLGSIISLRKLIPRYMFQLWFPIITFMTALFAAPFVTFIGGIVQALSTMFFLVIYPFLETEKFEFNISNEMKEYSGGMFIWQNINKRMRYVMLAYFGLITKYAFTNLSPLYALGGATMMLMTYFF